MREIDIVTEELFTCGEQNASKVGRPLGQSDVLIAEPSGIDLLSLRNPFP